MERFDQIYAKISHHIAIYFSGGIIVFMILYVTGHVFSRYALRMGGLLGTYSYVGMLLVPVTYFSLSHGWYKHSYICIDILLKRLKGKALWWVEFFHLTMAIIFLTGVFLVGGILETKWALEVGWRAGEAGYFMIGWPWKATMAVGALLLLIRQVLDMIRMIKTGEAIPRR